MIGNILLGIFLFVGFGAYRALRSDGWDDSNLLNWLRLLSHVFIHPEDFGQMYYVPEHLIDEIEEYGGVSKPFDYINKDEFAENFPDSRP
jgi:hypothetical protein